jgi:hypothetical protein
MRASGMSHLAKKEIGHSVALGLAGQRPKLPSPDPKRGGWAFQLTEAQAVKFEVIEQQRNLDGSQRASGHTDPQRSSDEAIHVGQFVPFTSFCLIDRPAAGLGDPRACIAETEG